tara:strand:+ start:718 stop:1008 length:291 start_codon:yes stop_codon:yes gene_type:complete
MWWFFFILFLLISIFCSTALFYALKRISQYESILIQFQQIVEFATEKMKEVDNSGHYEADDETGFFFKELKELQLLLDELFEKDETKEIPDAKTKK